jgi:hypothetical protein
MQVTDEMVRVAAEALWNYDGDGRPFSDSSDELKEYWLNASHAALTAALAAMWRPASEAEPNKTYLLGWHDWRDHAWCTEVAPAIHGQRFENGYSNVSRHGSATHFMPLPSPPKGGGVRDG